MSDDNDVRVRYIIDTDQAEESAAALRAEIGALNENIAQGVPGFDAFEGAAQGAASQLGEITGAVGAADDRFASFLDRMAAGPENADRFGQGLGRVGGAFSALGSILGSNTGAGQAAGLIGQVAQFGAQVFEVGNMLGGPGTGLVAVATTAAVGALPALYTAITETFTATHTFTEEVRENTEALNSQSEAALTAAESLDRLLQGVTTDSRRREFAEIGERIAILSDELAALPSTGFDALARRQDIEGQITRLSVEADSLGNLLAEEDGDITRGRRRSGGGGPRGPTLDQLAQRAGGSGRLDDAFFDGAVRDSRVELTQADALEEAKRREIEQLEMIEEKTQALGRMRLEQERRVADARERTHQQYLDSIQDELQTLQGVGQSIGGVFASSFQAAISGQKDFGQALAEGTKQQLIQYGTTMVAEGTGALLTGVGETFLNPPAAASKLAEGAGKIALGVGLGAAGAAIQTGAPAGGPQERPDSRTTRDQKTAPKAVVVNMNAPSVIGGTQDEWARMAAQNIQRAQVRF